MKIKTLVFLCTTFILSLNVYGASSEEDVLDSDEIATCRMPALLGSHVASENSEIISDHGVSITNKTAAPLNYKISYFHEALNMFADKMILNVTVNPGQTYSDVRRFKSKATWTSSGHFYTRATTSVVLEGKRMQFCYSNNAAYIM